MFNSLNGVETSNQNSTISAPRPTRMRPELRAALHMLRARIGEGRERIERLKSRDIRLYQVTSGGLVDLNPASIAEAEGELATAEQVLARYDRDWRGEDSGEAGGLRQV